MLKAGDLRHKICFLQKHDVTTTYGKEVQWIEFANIKAKVTQPRTDESDSEHGASRKQKLIVFIRYKANISENNRLIYKGIEFNITSCRDLKGTRRELIIDAEKRS